jgi:NAD(P)-dependent dehydrogenase (short-subunit alcohol dehydrogenase family)
MGKVCLVSGGTSGVGKAIAFGLAERGAELVILGKNTARGEAAAGEIIGKTGNSKITFLPVDLSAQDSIRSFAADFCDRYNRLDVLVNAAGILTLKRHLSPDGFEMTFAVDFLSHFLLTGLLLDLLRKSTTARIVTVAGSPKLWNMAESMTGLR